MIGGLQGEFGYLDNNYLKQNISKSRSKILGSFRRTLQLCMSDWVGATRGSRYVYPDKLKRPPLPSGCEISGCKMSTHGIPDVKMSAHGIFPGWTELYCARGTVCVCKVQGPLSRMTRSAQGYPDQLHPDFPRGHVPQCYPDSLRGKGSAMLSGAAPSGRQHILSGYIVRMENID